MSLVLSESLVLSKTRSQDLNSVVKLNCWGSGIKDVSLVRQLPNVEVIGLSCNEITTLKDFANCPKLKELILRNNKVSNIAEIAHLQNLPKLSVLWLDENPFVSKTPNYRKIVLRALPNLTVLDNKPVTREELQDLEEHEDQEDIPYESSHSTGSGNSVNNAGKDPSNAEGAFRVETPSLVHREASNQHQQQPNQQQANDLSQFNSNDYHEQSHDLGNEAFVTEMPHHSSQQLNESQYTNASNLALDRSMTSSQGRVSNVHSQSQRCLSSQGSVTALNSCQHPCGWSSNSNNNNNNGSTNNNGNSNNYNHLPKGGKSRKANILSAILCLIKELDYDSCEVVQTALNCRMEETSQ